MKKFFQKILAVLTQADPNEIKFWLAMLLLLIGVTGIISVYAGLIAVGGVVALESMITSYFVTWVNLKNGSKQ
jgi:hypothetical protein